MSRKRSSLARRTATHPCPRSRRGRAPRTAEQRRARLGHACRPPACERAHRTSWEARGVTRRRLAGDLLAMRAEQTILEVKANLQRACRSHGAGIAHGTLERPARPGTTRETARGQRTVAKASAQPRPRNQRTRGSSHAHEQPPMSRATLPGFTVMTAMSEPGMGGHSPHGSILHGAQRASQRVEPQQDGRRGSSPQVPGLCRWLPRARCQAVEPARGHPHMQGLPGRARPPREARRQGTSTADSATSATGTARPGASRQSAASAAVCSPHTITRASGATPSGAGASTGRTSTMPVASRATKNTSLMASTQALELRRRDAHHARTASDPPREHPPCAGDLQNLSPWNLARHNPPTRRRSRR